MWIRTVKPEFWTHRMHKRISESAALLALGLINYCDDEGRFEYDPVLIQSSLFPQRPLSAPVDQAIEELVVCGFVVLYRAEVNGSLLQVGCLPGLSKNQRINRPSKSRFPPPKRGTFSEGSLRTHGGLTEDSSKVHDGSVKVNEPSSQVDEFPIEKLEQVEDQKLKPPFTDVDSSKVSMRAQ